MVDDRELMQQALKALEKVCVMLDKGYNVLPNGEAHEDVSAAISALRERLAQPENGGKTGWPPGLLQDDDRKLSKWFASKPDARQRVREAVAQPYCDDCGGTDPECPLAQPTSNVKQAIELYDRPEQEPVAWGVDWGKAGEQSCVSIIKRLPGGEIEVLATEYGPPASKPWAGLTDEEVGTLTVFPGLFHVETPLLAKYIRAIEAKLKEKNT